MRHREREKQKEKGRKKEREEKRREEKIVLTYVPLLFQSLDGLLVLVAEEEEPDDCPTLLISPFSSLNFGIQSLSPGALTNRPWASEPT